jgi:DNA-binding transcriptional LysR family regulator
MLDLEEIYKQLIYKFGKTDKASKLLSFYHLLNYYSMNDKPVREIYPEDLFSQYTEALIEAGVFNNENRKTGKVNETYTKDQIEAINAVRLARIGLINLEWLRYFVIFAETHNTTEAAARLNITPQALSKSILGLENHYNVKLITRKKHFTGLTYAGKTLNNLAKSILSDLLETENFLRRVSKIEFEGELRIANTANWYIYLADMISYFFRRYPKLIIKAQVAPLDIEELIISGDIDLGFTIIKPARKELDYFEFAKTQYVIVSKPQKKKKWQELNYIETQMDVSGVGWPGQKYPRKIIIKSESIGIALELAKAGLGALYISEVLVKREIKEGLLSIVAAPPFKQYCNLYIIWNKSIPLTDAAQRFIYELRKMVKEEQNYD